MRIPITRPVFDEADLEAIRQPLLTGWVVQGPLVQAFEGKVADYTGARHAVAVTSCTTGLHLALAALEVKAGDEVVVPAFTWISTANVVEHLGARAVFADVSLDTFNVDVERMQAAITPRTRGLLPVHLFGLPADMDAVLALANDRGLFVVEDAACGLGARYHGRHVGTLGDFGAFSFHPRKAVTTGEGGIVTTADDARGDLLRCLRDHGASRSDLQRHGARAAFLLSEYDHLGYNYRMTDLQGALGSTQMDKLGWVQTHRTARAKRYDRVLAPLAEWLATPPVPAGVEHSYQSYVCLFRPETPSLSNVDRLFDLRNRLMLRLEERGVSTRQGTHAVAHLGYYREKYGIRPEDFPNAWMAERLSLTLPLYPQMTDEEQDFVVEQLEAAWREVR
jgi:dTDP-4-amino-4,6-dideoxygalactose transaminase